MNSWQLVEKQRHVGLPTGGQRKGWPPYSRRTVSLRKLTGLCFSQNGTLAARRLTVQPNR